MLSECNSAILIELLPFIGDKGAKRRAWDISKIDI